VLLLSGCALVPWAQAAGGLLVTLSALVLAACGGGGGGGGGGETIVWPAVVSLEGITPQTGFVLGSGQDNDGFGWSLAAGRDVTGDGKHDLLVGTPYRDLEGNDYGVVSLILGDSAIGETFYNGGDPYSTNYLYSHAAQFYGFNSYAQAGYSVAMVPDMNGDGLAEIVIGEPNYPTDRGRAWVLFGGGPAFAAEGYRRLELNFAEGIPDPGTEGFALVNTNTYGGSGGVNTENRLGTSVLGLNLLGDPFGQVAVAGPDTYYVSGYLYSVLPRVSVMGGEGGNIEGAVEIPGAPVGGYPGAGIGGGTGNAGQLSLFNSNLGKSMAVGDVNGDGVQDLIMSVDQGLSYDLYGCEGPCGNFGGAVVVFGRSSLNGQTVHPITGAGTLQVVGAAASYLYGDGTVAFLGDVNGDGVGDFAIAPKNTQSPLVVFGKKSWSATATNGILQFANPDFQDAAYVPDGVNGFSILAYDGSYPSSAVGAVAGHDLNNDGVKDIALGMVLFEGGSQANLAHVVFGRSGVGANGDVDVVPPLVPPAGFSIQAAPPIGMYGRVRVAFGDVNGDGFADLIVSNTNFAASSLGRVYVIFSPKP
jgi:hypothetical protein